MSDINCTTQTELLKLVPALQNMTYVVAGANGRIGNRYYRVGSNYYNIPENQQGEMDMLLKKN